LRTRLPLRRSSTDTTAGLGDLIGPLAGDGVGVFYELHLSARLPARELIDVAPPAGFHHSHADVPVETWSDNGAQALCLSTSLVKRGKYSLTYLADRLVQWMKAKLPSTAMCSTSAGKPLKRCPRKLTRDRRLYADSAGCFG
jgi:ADP-ribosylglycohydrolase